MKKQRIAHIGTRIGDMRNRILIHDRSIMPPAFGSIDFDESFSGDATWAAIKTSGGKVAMDDVGQDVNITHEIFIRHDADVTSETFVQAEDGRRFRLIAVENYGERNEYMRLLATDRGLNQAAKA